MSKDPIPQYYVGTSNAREGFAYTQERGAELHTDKKGNIKSLGNNRGRQLTYMNSGDKVYTASETKDILSKFDSVPKVGMNILAGGLMTNLTAPNTVNNVVDSQEIANLIGKKFDTVMGKYDNKTNVFEQNGTIYKQIGSKIPEVIGKSADKKVVVKVKNYKNFRD